MNNDKECIEISNKIYNNLEKNKIEVLFDDRDCSMGKKFSDNDLIGNPFQIIIGKRDIKENMVELKERRSYQSKKLEINNVVDYLIKKLFNN